MTNAAGISAHPVELAKPFKHEPHGFRASTHPTKVRVDPVCDFSRDVASGRLVLFMANEFVPTEKRLTDACLAQRGRRVIVR